MKKLISVVLGIACASCLMVPTMAADLPTNVGNTPNQDIATSATPRYSIFYRENLDSGSPWESPIITMEEGYGRYIRVWHQNTTDNLVEVVVTDVDTGEEYKPTIHVLPNDQAAEEYYMPSETSRIRLTITPLGDDEGENVAGQVAVGQYPSV